MTEKSPSDRYASCETLLSEIRTLCAATNPASDTLSGLSAIQDSPTEVPAPLPPKDETNHKDEIDEIDSDLKSGFAANVSDALAKAVSIIQHMKPPSDGNRRLISLALSHMLSTKISRDMERCIDVLRHGEYTDENEVVLNLWKLEVKKQPISPEC